MALRILILGISPSPFFSASFPLDRFRAACPTILADCALAPTQSSSDITSSSSISKLLDLCDEILGFEAAVLGPPSVCCLCACFVKNVNKFPLLTFSSTFPFPFFFSGLLLALLVPALVPRACFGRWVGAVLCGKFAVLIRGCDFVGIVD